MSSRRRRRGNTSADEPAEDVPPPAAAPPPAPDDDDDDDDDDNDARRPQSPSRGPADRRSTSTRQVLRRRQRVVDEHAPSTVAELLASLRAYLFGSRENYFLSRYQVAASTPLQMTLYFNIPFALIFACMNQLLFAWKSATWDLPLVVAVVSPMVFWVWAFVEPIRLLLGYVGNLHERVAWLGGFWVLSIFPQICVHIYFVVAQGNIGWFNLPIEIVMSCMYLLLVCGQMLLSYSTIKRLIAKAMADFHLTPIESDEASMHL